VGVPFHLVIAAPATNVANNFTVSLTAADQAVQSIMVARKKEKGRSSYMTVDLADTHWSLFTKLPDVAFFDVPVQLYCAPQDEPDKQPTLVFDGYCTAYDAKFPTQHMTVTAHDKGFKARTNAVQRALKNKTPLQAVQAIAADYGYTVDADVGDAFLIARVSEIGIPPTGINGMSDWRQIVRICASVGLTVHMQGSKMVVRQTSKTTYGRTFKPDDGFVRELDVRINHIGSGLGNNSLRPAFDNNDTDKAVAKSAATQAEAAKIKGGSAQVGRSPVGGRAAGKGTHGEDKQGARWSNLVTGKRHRKDEMTVITSVIPDLFPDHLVPFSGFGPKVDGNWEVDELEHQIVPGDGGSQTTTKYVRPTSSQAANQAGVAFYSKDLKI